MPRGATFSESEYKYKTQALRLVLSHDADLMLVFVHEYSTVDRGWGSWHIHLKMFFH